MGRTAPAEMEAPSLARWRGARAVSRPSTSKHGASTHLPVLLLLLLGANLLVEALDERDAVHEVRSAMLRLPLRDQAAQFRFQLICVEIESTRATPAPSFPHF